MMVAAIGLLVEPSRQEVNFWWWSFGASGGDNQRGWEIATAANKVGYFLW